MSSFRQRLSLTPREIIWMGIAALLVGATCFAAAQGWHANERMDEQSALRASSNELLFKEILARSTPAGTRESLEASVSRTIEVSGKALEEKKQKTIDAPDVQKRKQRKVIAEGIVGRVDPGVPKNDLPKPFPENIVTAWEKAGASAGWVRLDSVNGGLKFISAKEGMPGDLPALGLSVWELGSLGKLPAPPSAFGIFVDAGSGGVTDAHLKELTGFKNLQSLHLFSISARRLGLKELTAMKNLQSLDLGETKVTDAQLKDLAGLEGLKWLVLGGLLHTDEGLNELAALKNLQSLNLSGSSVTGTGLKYLTGMKNLEALDLRHTRVTDATLKDMAGLKSLKSMDLRSTKVTETGAKELRKVLPGCKVDWEKYVPLDMDELKRLEKELNQKR